MIILRRKSFSKNEEEKENIKGGALTATGIAGGYLGKEIGNALNYKFVNNVLSSNLTAKDKDIIYDKLAEKAKKQGIRVKNIPGSKLADTYQGSSIGRKVRDLAARVARRLRESGNPEEAKKLVETFQKGDIKEVGKDTIILGSKKANDSTAALAHELGHAQYMRPGRSKSVIGKTAHKLIGPSKLLSTGLGGKTDYIGPGISFVHGVRSGIKNEKNNQEGKKNNLWNKTRSVAVPIAIAAPLLVAEGKASAKGLRMMKEAGASKELLKQSRKNLGNSFGTYAGIVGGNALIGGAGEVTGRGIAKMTKKEKSKSKSSSNKNK